MWMQPGLEDFLQLTFVVPCFVTEDSETFTILPVEAVGVAEGVSVGS